MKIYIDAGHNHTGKDRDAIGNGLLEQDITVQIAKKTEKILNQYNIETKCSRNSETESIGYTLNESLTARYTNANNWGADLFVSMHCDSSPNTSAQGAHICIYGKGGEAEKMAKAIMPYLLELGLTGRSEQIQERTDLAVLRKTDMPAILPLNFLFFPTKTKFEPNPVNNPFTNVIAFLWSLFKEFQLILPELGTDLLS